MTQAQKPKSERFTCVKEGGRGRERGRGRGGRGKGKGMGEEERGKEEERKREKKGRTMIYIIHDITMMQ